MTSGSRPASGASWVPTDEFVTDHCPHAQYRVGRCTEVMAGVLNTPLGCCLPADHAGQHHDGSTGADWWPGWQRRNRLGRALIALGERLS